MKHILTSLCLLLLLACTGPQQQSSKQQQSFYQSMSSLCGQSFSGKVVFPADGKDPFAGAPLMMIMQNCSDSTIRIPFIVGEDKSRTWVISKTAEGLQLKHDHRHEDGTPDEVTMYGGMASTSESELEQRFPADAYTAELLPAAATNEWTLALSPDGKTFSYILKRDNQLRFRADFDLTKPLE
ncbi:hypothetical protein [Pontibacter flavimaris]|uniref:Uncharacterized protein n=1 Tax=Pontibacter flavimaris TaxID=1797110 RepID=A0A1Q5PEH1_9BACT|nr:hypothetical protein [Pontibacter flavimaris]OKL40640.1 hypothetical protein A3841_12315 [Pontibacter flavimaris]